VLAKFFGLLKRAFLCRLFRMGESVYLNDNASVEAILYEKKNGYFSFFFKENPFSGKMMKSFRMGKC